MNKIPESFQCAGFTIKINIVDKLLTNVYGNFCDATNIINIARKIRIEEEDIELSEEQMFNTLFHEVFHCFQFYSGNEYSEQQAQVYANFMCEYLKSIN